MHDLSQKYHKFLVEILYNNQSYYTVCGLDFSDDADKMLIDLHKNLVLFKEVNSIRDFVGTNVEIFDRQNIIDWLALSGNDLQVNSTMDFDILASDQFPTPVATRELFDSLLYLSDYFYQVNASDLIEIYESEKMSGFINDFYDKYLWMTRSDAVVDGTVIKNEANTLYNLLKERIVIL